MQNVDLIGRVILYLCVAEIGVKNSDCNKYFEVEYFLDNPL